jgi:hypothetical protein
MANVARHQFLPRAVFPEDQNAAVRGRGHRNQPAERHHRRTLTDHFVVRLDARPQGDVLRFQAALANRVAHDQDRLVER